MYVILDGIVDLISRERLPIGTQYSPRRSQDDLISG